MKKTVSFSRNSTNLFFHILTGCNLSCKHCYINREQHGTETLPFSTIESWLTSFSERSREANVIFLGGEPTLHPDLSLAVKKARSLGYKSITIDTNGYLFHDILDKVSPSEVDFMSFSLDGATGETNDPIRGEGSFERCTAGIREAVEKGFNTSLIFTVSSNNIHDLEKMPALLGDLGIRRFFIQVIGLRGNSAGEDKKSLQVDKTLWLNTIPKVAEKAADLGITVTWPKVFLGPEEPFECAGLVAENYFIFPNGRVYRCPLCEDFPLHSHLMEGVKIADTPKINESDMFRLNIPEGCVMNRLIQPDNISYGENGAPEYRIACCLLKEEIGART